MALDTSNWTQDDLLKEARMQTAAIQKIKAWLRLAYSAATVGFLLGWWGIYGSGPFAVGVLGVVLLVAGVLLAVPIKIGVTNAEKNVERILAAVEGKSGVGQAGGEAPVASAGDAVPAASNSGDSVK